MSKSKKLRALTKQAKMGNPCAMYRLGIRYQLGIGFAQDMKKAADWIACAAEMDYAPAIEWINDYSFDDNACVQANS